MRVDSDLAKQSMSVIAHVVLESSHNRRTATVSKGRTMFVDLRNTFAPELDGACGNPGYDSKPWYLVPMSHAMHAEASCYNLGSYVRWAVLGPRT